MLTVRAFEPSDHKAVLELHHLGLTQIGADRGPGPWDDDLSSPEAVASVYADARGRFLVGLVNDRIVAMGAILLMSADRGEIKRMRVHPDCQRLGYGQAILDQLEMAAATMRIRHLSLDTTSLQRAAIAFYEKNGYVESGRRTEQRFRVIAFEKYLNRSD
jgi:ribosomal protein S18 acetylase RimI-like enzyme